MTDKSMVYIYPFVVRCQDGRQASVYARNASGAALQGEERLKTNEAGGNPAVLVIRADEPYVRDASWLRRFVERFL